MRLYLRRPAVVAVLAASLTTAALVLSSAPAQASSADGDQPSAAKAGTSVTIGATSATTVPCNSAVTTGIQGATALGSPSYKVPTAGVVTSYNYTANGQAGSFRALFATPAAGGAFTVAAKTPTVAAAVSAVNTVKVRVPVAAGAVLGLWVSNPGMACTFAGAAGDVVSGYSFNPDASNTTPTTSIPAPTSRVNLSAVVESDVDKDGFGDVSQDLCPQSAATQLACPAPQTIQKGKTRISRTGVVRVAFKSSIAGSKFECEVDGKRWKPCTSPLRKDLKPGRHKIRVQATSPFGIVDPTPLKVRFNVPR